MRRIDINPAEYPQQAYYHFSTDHLEKRRLFSDRKDFIYAVNSLAILLPSESVQIIAYCLMDNHLHLLLRVEDGVSMLVKKVASSYVYYFNHKYDRIGHLFQDRYKSEAVNSDDYLLTVARYILQNPLKAGLCGIKDYRWSSWAEIETNDGLCDTQVLCECVGDRQSLLAYCLTPSDDTCLDIRESKAIRDDEARSVLCRIARMNNPSDIATLEKHRRNTVLAQAKAKGLSVRQISRITGLERNIVQRA